MLQSRLLPASSSPLFGASRVSNHVFWLTVRRGGRSRVRAKESFLLLRLGQTLSIPAGGDRIGRKNVSLVRTSFRILIPDNVVNVCIVIVTRYWRLPN